MNSRNGLRLASAVAFFLTVCSVQAQDNTGTGGVITYTDASGLNPVASPPYIGGYVVHTFTNSGTLNIPIPASADVLVVAGGGAGGNNGGGGGGAGGLIYSNAFTVIAGSNYTVTVGVGAVPKTPYSATWTQSSGSNSVFGILTALGGGGGGSRGDLGAPTVGLSGGSGGGGGSKPANGGSGTAGQGNNGGNGVNTAPSYGGGGGGGAVSAGANGTGNAGGNGGNGVANSISGSSVTYAGGGGGGIALAGTGGTGGLGGGGAGSQTTGGNGTPNTGGGGGGGGGTCGSGGSGIVIVRYPYDAGSLYVSVTVPANGQICFEGSLVTATATVASGTSPYNVSFFADTDGGGMVQVGTTQNGAGPTFTQSLGTPANGTYQVYASVTDSESPTAATDTSVTNAFTVMVPSSNAYLSNLVPSVGTFSPAFTSNTFSYTESVANAVSSLTVTPTAAEPYATIRVNGVLVASGSASASIGLSVGANVIANQVISQDMAVTNTYTLTVTRARASSSFYWSGNGSTQGGNGTWDTANTTWGTVAGGPFGTAWDNAYNDTAIFGGTAGTVTLGENVKVGGLTFNTSGYTIGGAYTLALSANNSIVANVASPGRIIGFADGVVVTNVYQVQVGYGNGFDNNSLTLTNGARIFVANNTYIGYTTGGNGSSGNKLTIAGGAADSIYNAGNQNVNVGYGSAALAAGNQIVIGTGGSMTNVANIDIGRASTTSADKAATRNAIRVTGGKLFTSGSMRVGASSGSTAPSRTNALTVTDGGVVNVAGGLYVGVTGYNIYSTGDNTTAGNSLTITNGGLLFTKADCYIGSDADNLYNGTPAWKGTLLGNMATIGGSLNGTNATWDLGAKKLYVGYAGYVGTLPSIAMYNSLTASEGGMVTNISTLTVKADNTVALAPGGQIYATVATINGTLSVSTDDAVTPSCGRLTVSGNLNVANATLNLVVPGNARPGAVYILGSYGTLTGSFKGTNGLPEGCSINMNYNDDKKIALLIPPPRGTLMTVR